MFITGYCTKSKCLDSLLKDVIIYCVLFDQTGNIVDGTVQRRHLNQYIKFIFTQRMLKDQFYSLFYCDRRKFNLICFFIFLFMVTGRGIIFICSAGILTTYHKWQIILQNLFFFQKIEVLLVLFLVAQKSEISTFLFKSLHFQYLEEYLFFKVLFDFRFQQSHLGRKVSNVDGMFR